MASLEGTSAYTLEVFQVPENDLGYERPWLYEKQLEGVFCTARYAVVEASTKSGKTVACLVWLAEQAILFGGPNKNFWWVAPVSDQADIAFRRMQEALPRDMFTANQSRKYIKLWNGSLVWFKSADKPDCYDDQTEILTSEGWKLFSDLSRAEEVLTRNPDTGVAEWHKPDAYFSYEYTGEMRKVSSNKLDLLVTPDHKFFVVHTKNKRKKLARFATLDEIDFHHEAIPSTCEWTGQDNGISYDNAAYMGIYLAEGSAAGSRGGTSAIANGDYTVHITQSKGDKGGTKGNVREKTIDLLERMGYNVNTSRDDVVFVRDKELWSQLVGLGHAHTKRIPKEYKELPPDKLRTLLYWMALGDGTIRRGEGLGGRVVYYTVSKGLADDFQEIAIKAGFSATVRKKKQSPSVIKGRVVTGQGFIWKVSLHRTKKNYLRSTKKEYVSTEQYDGMVYCVNVPNHTVMVRRNGKVCWSGNSLYGEDVYAAVVDEATRCKDESWYALRSTLTATLGPVRIIGNVKGRANWMYKMARLAQSGDEANMHYVKITAYDAAAAGVITYDEIKDAKKIYPEIAFRELYLAEPADDGGNPFGIVHIQKCIKPMSDDRPVAWGWDVAKHNNWTVGIALDREGNTCRFHRWQDTWDNTIRRMMHITQGCMATVDSTGSGDQLLERLRTSGHTNFNGYVFGGWKSKQDIMLGLAVAIQNREITFPEGVIVEELEAFEYVNVESSDRVLYAAPRGVHNDCVDALAMAVKLWRSQAIYGGDAVPILISKTSGWVIQ